jgi:hypothetical protein
VVFILLLSLAPALALAEFWLQVRISVFEFSWVLVDLLIQHRIMIHFLYRIVVVA